MSTLMKRSCSVRRALFFFCLALTSILATMPPGRTQAGAQGREGERSDKSQPGSETFELLAAPGKINYGKPSRVTGGAAAFTMEAEPNDTVATAQPLAGTSIRVRGNIQPETDEDYYSFTAAAGDRVYVAIQTALSSGGSGLTGDSVIEIIDTDGMTVLEEDDDDGSFAGTSSSIAGTVMPSSGTYFIRVSALLELGLEIHPYDLYVRVQSGTPVPETEPNNDDGEPNPLLSSGWVSGVIGSDEDNDTFSLTLNAGDTVYISLDADPERDSMAWNPRLAFGVFDGFFLVINDGNTISPNSEAFFFTVKEAGNYIVYVDEPLGASGDIFTYHLSVSVFPANSIRECTTYVSTDVPKAIPIGTGLVSSTLTVPDNTRIGNLKVSLNITHSNLGELDVTLVAPDGNEVLLFDDPPAATAGATAPQIDFTLDDEAGVPVAIFGVNKPMIYQPDFPARLYWFKNQNAAGVWTLNIRDDGGTGSGTLNGWSITVCEDPPLPACSTAEMTVFSSDFEADDGGFTHTGSGDEWERGLPTAAPITSCNSGVNCWKTDLDGTYNNAGSGQRIEQELFSPNIDLTAFTGQRITFEWAMKYQIEGAHWDHGFVEVREVGNPSNVKRVWEHTGPTMTRSFGGPPSVTINSAAGWGTWQADISEFAGTTIRLVFHIDHDDLVALAGMAIDDVKVTACSLVASCPTSIGPTSESFAASGGMGSITVTAEPDCNWTAVSNNPEFITITSGSSGSGNGTVTYTVLENTATTNRAGTISIGSLTFTVVQGAAFLDVPPTNIFYEVIGKLSARGVTVGCGGGNFCPDQVVTREQMAAFIIRALGEFNPPEPPMQRFADVPPTNPFYAFIDRMAVLGITVGCDASNYCPSDTVLRQQMATFIIRALGEFDPPEPAMQRFLDVPPTNPFYRFIDRLAELGITQGCDANNFCPELPVTRAQMAAFLVRAFNL